MALDASSTNYLDRDVMQHSKELVMNMFPFLQERELYQFNVVDIIDNSPRLSKVIISFYPMPFIYFSLRMLKRRGHDLGN